MLMSDAPPPIAYACPTCGQPVEVTPLADVRYVTCPSCGDEFSVPAADVPGAITRDDELDGLRIRQLATARRAAYRARSYAIIAAAVCLVATGQFLWIVRTAPLRYALFAAASLAGFVYFARMARRLNEEATRPTLAEPVREPDFTSLGDGSEAWKKLNDIS